MPYVVTQPCCADASCVSSCPVNCIHPTPDDPDFATAEMVYIDAAACVDCGSCVTACPVGAIKKHTQLDESEQVYADLAVDYYQAFPHADRTPMFKIPATRPLQRREPLRVAVVGSGPAGMYAVDELLKYPQARIDIFERHALPYGLARYGVAPDHGRTRAISGLFDVIAQEPAVRLQTGVTVGSDDLTPEALQQRYDAVIYATGAGHDRQLGIPGEDLVGVGSATEFVAWYNGDPDYRECPIPLDRSRVTVIGNGNVALDVARILLTVPQRLEGTAIAPAALQALHASAVREVVVLGRRGPEHAAATTPELIGLAAHPDFGVRVAGASLPQLQGTAKLRALRQLAESSSAGRERQLVLQFDAVPTSISTGPHGLTLALESGEPILSGGILRAVGYRVQTPAWLPADPTGGHALHAAGRIAPGTYVVGWLKRGPRGFLGTNKFCSIETVQSLVQDYEAGLLSSPPR